MAAGFKTYGHEDKFWNLGPMPTGPPGAVSATSFLPPGLGAAQEGLFFCYTAPTEPVDGLASRI